MQFSPIRSRGSIVGLSAFGGILLLGTYAQAAAITPGDLVVTRAVGGSGSYNTGTGQMTTPSALTGGGVAATVVLDEYTPTGTFVQSIVMPNTQVPAATGGNRALTFSGTQNTEGAITLSGDGRFLVVAGYNQTAGSASTNNTTSALVERVVGLVDMNGNINTTTALTDVASGQPVRSAYSTNGTDIWVNGASGTSPTGGVHYATVGSTTSTQLITTGVTNHRVLNGFGGQLYLSNNNGGGPTLHGVSTVGSGFPTTTGQTLTQLPGFGSANAPTPSAEQADDYWFKDASTLYIADNRNGASNTAANGNGGIQKWTFDGTNWNFQYFVQLGLSEVVASPTNFVGAHGLAGTVDGSGNAVLYATTFDNSNGAFATRLVKLTDDGVAADFTASLTTLAVSPLNGTFATAFRGVEVIPVPEPATVALAGVAMLGLFARRRRV